MNAHEKQKEGGAIKIAQFREKINLGDKKEQMAHEVKRLGREERDDIMKAANFTITILPEQGLAMKADLCIPWNKLRLMRR